jgi:hypothetical protein
MRKTSTRCILRRRGRDPFVSGFPLRCKERWPDKQSLPTFAGLLGLIAKGQCAYSRSIAGGENGEHREGIFLGATGGKGDWHFNGPRRAWRNCSKKHRFGVATIGPTVMLSSPGVKPFALGLPKTIVSFPAGFWERRYARPDLVIAVRHEQGL